MEGHVSRLTADHDRGYPARRAHFTGKIANSKKRPISFSRPKCNGLEDLRLLQGIWDRGVDAALHW